jgi:6-pyruvoyltetrahydropterin/6-carboxytetrahydropterin synthase
MTFAARYSVRVQKDELVFSAAHFITLQGNVCERLHGHNYRVEVEIHGPLDDNQYVCDFIAVRDGMRALVQELDHRMLLPTRHKQIHVSSTEREVTAVFADRRWVFPREDCCLLPIENTTAELLAHYLAERFIDRLRFSGGGMPEFLLVRVEENFGQWATCEVRLE